MLKDVFIVDAKRTPIGSFGGQFKNLSAVQLGTEVVKNILEKNSIEPNNINEIIVGNVLSAGLGQNAAKQIAKHAGLADSTISTLVNKVCASGLKSIMYAAQTISLNQADCIIAGGIESMSQAPFYSNTMRWGKKLGHVQFLDSIMNDGLQDPFSGVLMGACGELCAKEHTISREDQDLYTILTYKRSLHANESGLFEAEIVPITIEDKKSKTLIVKDEEPYLANFEKVLQLKPIFAKENGTITAANASKNADGASFVLLMSQDKMESLNLKPLAKIIAYADYEQDPQRFTTSPAFAAEKLLHQTKISKDQIDFWECNEAFAVVSLANQRILNIPDEKWNIHGGAVAIGHPLGCSGARILVSLSRTLCQEKGKYGIAMICNGGGGASAVLIENLCSC